jgi:glutamate--cysteine ligase
VGDVAVEVVRIARAGLKARNRTDGGSNNEAGFLDVLADIAERRETLAEAMIARFDGVWGGEVDPVFIEYAY